MSASPLNLNSVRKVLLLGAHPDDIEIGCGGTVFKMIRDCPGIEVRWHVFSSPGARRSEAQRCAREFLKDAKKKTITVENFRERYFPDQWSVIKRSFDKIGRQFDPDLVFTHRGDDHHQDHRVLSELTWNTFRNHLVFEYEIPKYEGDLGQPNFYVSLDKEIAQRKVSALMKYFPTQTARHWFTEDLFLGLMRLRGIECGPKAYYAEAFHARKCVW